MWNPETSKVVISRNVVFNESAMLHDGTATNGDVESEQKSSVQVEHVIGSGDSSEKENIAVHDAPIAEDPHRPRRDPRPPKRLIEEANIVAYALSVADEIEGNAFQCRVL